MGATGWLECFDATSGKLIWESQLCSRQEDEILFGFCSSPLILERLVYVTVGKPNASLVAVDLDTGHTVWSKDNRTAGYSSPHPFKHDHGMSILVFDAAGLHAYDAIDGQLQWSFDWGDNSDEQVNVCQPVVVNKNQILISSGYGRGTAFLEVEKNESGWAVRQRWVSKRLRAKFSSVVVKDGFVFGLDEGGLTCVDLESGHRVWKSGRYGHGQLMLCGDWLMIQAERGDLVLVRATEKGFEESRRISALSDRTWNYPILAGDCILMRNDREAVCFQIVE
jgi:outer membrane protein assembly factor BamB